MRTSVNIETGEVTEEQLEVVTIEVPKATELDYKRTVSELILRRYSLSDEISILRQRDIKTDEYNEWFEYVEGCKVEARSILGI